jgi:alpha-methylacyl-CoA racemase
MMLADMGADVIRLERGVAGALGGGAWNLTNRGRPSVGIDLKNPQSVGLVLRLLADAEALVEGFRPGVMEKLGLGPDECLKANPRLVYGRMTGYGQDGPMSKVAGHDINYISLAGALGAIARRGERPLAPLNLVGDYGGGGMMLAFGVVCGILEARTSGEGQVVDASMVEGTAVLTTIVHAMRSGGMWNGEPGTNLLDSGAPFYEVYEASDGGHVAVGAIEPQFYAELLRLMELDPTAFPQFDQARWPEFKERFAEVFKTRTRDEWAALLEPAEACSTAVPAIAEAPSHPHNVARKVFVEVDGVVQPAPAPRFSRTAPEIRHGAHDPGADTDTALAAWGLGESEIADLRAAGAVS